MIDKLVIAINALWLWCCLAPTLLGIATLIIKIAKNNSYSLQMPHKHDFDYHSINLEKNLLEETDINKTYEIRNTYQCNGCKETKMRSYEVTYGK